MSSPKLRIRRATTDDFQGLKSLWNSMRLPADELESRLTEFQVIESADGQIAGAIGVQIIRQHALLHSEGYADFSVADAARELFWERIQIDRRPSRRLPAVDAGKFAVLEPLGIPIRHRRKPRAPAGRMETFRREMAHASA